MECEPLTESQRQLVLDNLASARAAASKYTKGRRRWLSYEDALSSAYMGLVDAARRYDKTKAQFTTSGTRRAQGQILDDLRKKSKWFVYSPGKVGQRPKTISGKYDRGVVEIDGAEQRESVAKILEPLEGKERLVMVLNVLEGLSIKETAKAMGYTEAGVFHFKKHAIRKIREYHGNDLRR